MKVPKITNHYKSVEEFEIVAKQYFILRPKLLEYKPPEMRKVLRITPDQLGIITVVYNRSKGDFDKCMDAVQKKSENKEFISKKEIKNNQFAKYTDYLKSDYWRKHRQVALKQNRRCVLCNKRATHIHHRTYKRRGTPLEVKDIVSLCKFCHDLFHENHFYENKDHLFYQKPPF